MLRGQYASSLLEKIRQSVQNHLKLVSSLGVGQLNGVGQLRHSAEEYHQLIELLGGQCFQPLKDLLVGHVGTVVNLFTDDDGLDTLSNSLQGVTNGLNLQTFGKKSRPG